MIHSSLNILPHGLPTDVLQNVMMGSECNYIVKTMTNYHNA